MKRQFSFTNNQSRHLRLDSDSFDHPQLYNHKPGKSYKYSHQNHLKDSQNSVHNTSWTDLRVQEIKRKYDTPSYRNQSQRTDSLQRHNRIKTELDYPSESKKNYQPRESFSNIRRETNKDAYVSKKAREQSKENSFATKVQSKYQVRAFDQRPPLSEQSLNYGNQKKSYRKQQKQTERTSRRREDDYKNHVKRQGIQQSKQNKDEFEDDQVIVFKKIQQMKQSILNQKRRPHAAPSTIQSRNTYHRSSLEGKQYQPLKDYTNNQEIDPRVKNIDKINSKIKHILDCLHDNQYISDNKPAFEQKKRYQNRDIQSSIQNRNEIPNQNQGCFGLFYKDSISKDISRKGSLHNLKFSNNFQQTKILERQQIRYADQKKNSQSQLYQSNDQRRNIVLDNSKIVKKSQSLEQGQQFNDKNDRKWRQQFVKEEDKRVSNRQHQQNQYRDRDRSRSFLITGFEKKSKQGHQYSNHKGKVLIQRQKSEDLRLNSGKKLDDEISRIQKRIKLFEQEKRKLQINFKPFQYIKNTRNTRSSSNFLKADAVKDNRVQVSIPRSIDSQSTNNFNQFTSRRKVSQFRSSVDQIIQKYQRRNKTQQNQDFAFNARYIHKEIQSRPSSKKLVIQRHPKEQQIKQLQQIRKAKQFEEKRKKQQFQQRRNAQQAEQKRRMQQFQDRRRQKQMEEKRIRQQFEQKKRQRQLDEKKASQQLESKRKQQELQKDRQLQQMLQMKRRQEQQLSLKAGQGIQQRKRKLAKFDDQDSLFTTETKKLVERLSKQAQIDQQFRNAKIWMDYLESMRPKEKVQKLKQVLKEKNINISQQEIEREFLVTEEENNPFYSHRQGSNNFEVIVQKYIQSSKYWTQNVRHAFSLELLKRQKLIEGKLDLERKGFVILGDLVRFLNIESGRFYRNRDLILIWRRLTIKGQGIRINFDKLLSELTQKQ